MRIWVAVAAWLIVACSRSAPPAPARSAVADEDAALDPIRRAARERDRRQGLELPRFDSSPLTAKLPRAKLGELSLFDLDAKPVQLASDPARLRLIVLSSLSCPASRDNSRRLGLLSERYGEKLSVTVIYTREAHPQAEPSPYSGDVWITERNVVDRIFVDQPKTLAQRIGLAKRYQEHTGSKLTLLVDALDDAAWKRIGSAPNAAILVDRGEVLVRQGWFTPEKMDAEIARHFKQLTQNHADDEWRGLDKDVRDGLSFARTSSEMRQVLAHAPQLIDHDFGGTRSVPNGGTALHVAAAEGDSDLVRDLLHWGASIELTDDLGRTPLQVAAVSGKSAVVARLLAARARLHTTDLQGLTAVQLALIHQHPELARQLLAAGAAQDVRVAAGLGELSDLSRHLRQLSYNDLYRKRDGGQALAYAAANRQIGALDALLDSGVDATQEVDHQPALFYALQNLDAQSVALLLDRGPLPNIDMRWPGLGPLHWLADERKGRVTPLELTRMLLDHGADANDLDADGCTALHYAARQNDLELAKTLLDHRANVNARSGAPHYEPCGPLLEDVRPVLRTPLHEALERRQLDMAALLLAHGADPALEDRDGLTALDLAPEADRAAVVARLGKLPLGKHEKSAPKYRSLMGL